MKPKNQGASLRDRSHAILSESGFHASPSLPTSEERDSVRGKARPVREVALRLMALNALYTWTCSPKYRSKSKTIKTYIERNDLKNHLTTEELAILSLPRAEANEQHAGSMGRKLENMWALAWVLGFDPAPDPTQGQISDTVSGAFFSELLPSLGGSLDDLRKVTKPRSLTQVVRLEDVFYCSHNAVRSAQAGSKKSVPETFDPIRDGGAIHERRHALTWSISPEVTWGATDLST